MLLKFAYVGHVRFTSNGPMGYWSEDVKLTLSYIGVYECFWFCASMAVSAKTRISLIARDLLSQPDTRGGTPSAPWNGGGDPCPLRPYFHHAFESCPLGSRPYVQLFSRIHANRDTFYSIINAVPFSRACFSVQWCTKCAVMNENVQWWKAVCAVMN